MKQKVIPGIVFALHFYPDGVWECGQHSFIDYMERPQAFKIENHSSNEYRDFIDYMSNEEKSDGIFDISSDLCSAEKLEYYRKCEVESNAQRCCRYAGVISFDNKFLEEHGLLSSGGLESKKLKELARSGMSEMIHTSKKLEDSNAYWYAAIHSNTDNIHIHFSILEYNKRNRKYDQLEVDAFDALKSKVVNQILGNEKTVELTNLINQTIMPDFKRTCFAEYSQLMKLYNELPKNQTWQYGRKSFKPYREQVNLVVDNIINSNPQLKEHFEEYKNLLAQKEKEYKQAYGIGDRNLYKKYKATRIKEFYTDCGNYILKELQNPDFQKSVEDVKEDLRAIKSCRKTEEKNDGDVGARNSRKIPAENTEEKNKEISRDDLFEHIISVAKKKKYKSYNAGMRELQYDMSRLSNQTETMLRRSAAQYDRHIDYLIRQYDYEQERKY